MFVQSKVSYYVDIIRNNTQYSDEDLDDAPAYLTQIILYLLDRKELTMDFLLRYEYFINRLSEFFKLRNHTKTYTVVNESDCFVVLRNKNTVIDNTPFPILTNFIINKNGVWSRPNYEDRKTFMHRHMLLEELSR